MADNKIRLQKYISECGVASRRKAEELIAAGKVKVNGKPASIGDKVDPKRERGKTMNYLVAYILSMFTFAIVMDIWHYHIAGRVEEALERRNIDYNFNTSDFWKWFLFGSLIFVGPFIYFHKLCTAMNLLCQSYNEKPILDE